MKAREKGGVMSGISFKAACYRGARLTAETGRHPSGGTRWIGEDNPAEAVSRPGDGSKLALGTALIVAATALSLFFWAGVYYALS